MSAETYPEPVPDLYLGQPLVITTRMNKTGGQLTVNGQGPGGSWRRELGLETARQHKGVAGLWARDKLERLNDAIALNGESDALRSAMLTTALDHRLVSRYTSFVAVEQQPSRLPSDKLEAHDVANARPAGQSAQPFAYPSTATTAVEKIWAGTIALFIALLSLVWFRRIINIDVRVLRNAPLL